VVVTRGAGGTNGEVVVLLGAAADVIEVNLEEREVCVATVLLTT
jgi:hypothetical protein